MAECGIRAPITTGLPLLSCFPRGGPSGNQRTPMYDDEFGRKDLSDCPPIPAHPSWCFGLTHRGTRATWRRRWTSLKLNFTEKDTKRRGPCPYVRGLIEVSRPGRPSRQGSPHRKWKRYRVSDSFVCVWLDPSESALLSVICASV